MILHTFQFSLDSSIIIAIKHKTINSNWFIKFKREGLSVLFSLLWFYFIVYPGFIMMPGNPGAVEPGYSLVTFCC